MLNKPQTLFKGDEVVLLVVSRFASVANLPSQQNWNQIQAFFRLIKETRVYLLEIRMMH